MNLNMMIRKTLISMVAVGLIGAAVPAFADDQQHSRGGQSNGRAQGGSPSRAPQAQARQAAPAPQAPNGLRGPQAVQRQAQGPVAASPNGRTFAQPRGPIAVAPHAAVAPGAVAVTRGGAVVTPRGAVVTPNAVAVPRGSVSPYYATPYYGHGYGYAVARPYYYPPHAVVVHPNYYYYPYGGYPYYHFHSHFSIGFGFFVGYPVAYPGWYNPYAVGTFGYGVSTGVAYGGLSFDVQPYDAAVFVDGTFIGAAGDFGPQAAPLTLRAGLHHIELRADGSQPMAFDITVVPGQVIPYQGTMPVIR
jgi:hypothetical protein